MSRRSDLIPVAIAVLVPMGLVMALAFARPAPAPLLSALELRLNRERFDGKVVRVHGWIDSCEMLSCLIASVPDFTDRLDLSDPKKIADIREHRVVAWSIGKSERFDALIRPLIGRHVVVRARFDAACTKPDMMCLDRAMELKPIFPDPILLMAEN